MDYITDIAYTCIYAFKF